MIPVRDSTLRVVQAARHVHIQRDAVNRLCTVLGRPTFVHWLSGSPVDLAGLAMQDRIPFVFVVNAISFCYWGEPKWTVNIGGHLLDGAYALVACLARALEQDTGRKITDPTWLASISESELDQMTRGNVCIPLLANRVAILNDLGKVITTKYGGRFLEIVEKAEFDAVKLVELILKDMPSFRDTQLYNGRRVVFNKRAQLLVSDIDFALGLDHPEGRGLGGLEVLTACADYKVPQVLRRHRILEYENGLAEKIARKEPLGHGSREEIEIRACTVWAVEYVTAGFRDKGVAVLARDINDYLWMSGQHKLPSDEPYHRTRTTAY